MFKEFFNSLLITDKNDLGKNHENGGACVNCNIYTE